MQVSPGASVVGRLAAHTPGYSTEVVADLQQRVDRIEQVEKSTSQDEIEQVAGEFETLFTTLLLKEMRKTLEPDTLFGKDPGDVYGGLFDMFLGQSIAQSGGLGVGAMVQSYLETQSK